MRDQSGGTEVDDIGRTDHVATPAIVIDDELTVHGHVDRDADHFLASR